MDMADYREVFKRTEIKYLLDEEQYQRLIAYLETIAYVDEYGLSRINNIYFDTPDYVLARTSMEKPLYKEKLRLRTYGETGDDTNSFIEIKKKYAGIVYKRRISGRYADTYDYLTQGSEMEDSSQISREIRAFLKLYGRLRPAMSVCYDRIAMAGIEDKEFRVTFDSNITWDDRCTDLRKIKGGNSLLKPGQRLMEIKVCNAMPMQLSRKLSELSVFPVSFSKYCSGYKEMISIRGACARMVTRTAETGSIWIPYRLKGGTAYV